MEYVSIALATIFSDSPLEYTSAVYSTHPLLSDILTEKAIEEKTLLAPQVLIPRSYACFKIGSDLFIKATCQLSKS